ncbi:MAG: hypothetical protein PHS14_15125 [Elusimicrobia bacterium]|nr:hypothetical protein [Elusimicrobiota bacterium]
MARPDNFAACEHTFLPLNRLEVHPTIQRRFDEARAQRLAEKFDPDFFGEIAVIKRNGAYLVVDGQHRKWAATKALGADQLVPCRVYDGAAMDTPRLAAVFVGLNDAKKLQPIDLYKQRCRAGDQAALGIKGVLAKFGLVIDQTRKPGVVQSVTACFSVYRAGAGAVLFTRTIALLHTAWDGKPDAYHHSLIRGTALVLEHYGSGIDDKALAHKMSSEGEPDGFLGMARTIAKATPCSVDRAMAQRIVNLYNKGKSIGRLAPLTEEK